MAQLILDPVANGVATAWAGNGYLDVDDGATADDANWTSSGVTLDTRESYRVANVSAGQIPDGSIINYVRVLTRAQRGGASNATYVTEIGYGAGPTWSPGGTLTTVATFTDFTTDWTTDPSTAAAWTVATLRAWATTRDFGVRNTQTRDVQLSRLRVLIDYTPPITPPLAGNALSAGQGVVASRTTDGVTLGGLAVVGTQGVIASAIAKPLTGVAATAVQGGVALTGVVIIPPVGYAGRWPDWLDSNYETLDPYFLTPTGPATAVSSAPLDVVVPLAGQTASVVQGSPAVAQLGGIRTVVLLGGTIASSSGVVFRDVVAGGAVMVRSRFKAPQGYQRWRRRSRLVVVAPAFQNSTRTVNLTGQQLASSQGSAVVTKPGAVQPLVQVVSRRLRDRVRSWIRRSSVLTVVTRQTSTAREPRPAGQVLGVAQGSVAVVVPRPSFVGQTVQLVSTRTRKRWQTLGRPKTVLTTVASASMNARYLILTGQSVGAVQGAVTTTGVPHVIAPLSGTAGTLGQGTLAVRVTDGIALAGASLQLQQGTVTVARMVVQGSSVTLGQGTVSMGSLGRTVVLTGAAVVSALGTMLRTLELRGNTVLSVAPTIRKYVVVSLDGAALVTFEHRVVRGGTATIEANATLTVAPVQRYVGTVTTGGTATLTIDMTIPPSTVAAMYQQFEAEQRLGYKI
jgi:hypothetical protein